MTKFLYFLIGFGVSIQTFSQAKITGQIIDYNDNVPVQSCIVRIDTTFIKSAFSTKFALFSDEFGHFEISSDLKSTNINLYLSQVGFEDLMIINIPNSNGSIIDLKQIIMLGGSYNWDGECITKRFWGLINIKKRCGGYVKGIIESNPDSTNLLFSYPNDSTEKKYSIDNKILILDYKELTK